MRLLQRRKEYGKDGKIDMCEGLKGLIEDGREEGKAEGRIEIITAFLSDGGTAEAAGRLLNASAEEIMQADAYLKKREKYAKKCSRKSDQSFFSYHAL